MSHKSIGNRIRQIGTSHQRELVLPTEIGTPVSPPASLSGRMHDLALTECITPP